MASILFFSVAALGAAFVSAWAHQAERNRSLAVALYVTIAGIGALLVLIGAVLFLFDLDDQVADADMVGLMLVGTGLVAGLPLLRIVRSALAKVTPLDPDSIPEMVALCILLAMTFLLGFSSLVMTEELEIAAVGIVDLVAQAIGLVLISYFSVGLFITRDFQGATRRLGIGGLSAREVAISLALVFVLFLIIGLSGYLTQTFQPELSDEIQTRSTELIEDVATVPGALTLGLSAGVGEEMLFRGAVQPIFGIGLTSLLFALVHVQYGLSFILVGVFLASVLFGWQRRRFNTTAAILTHAVYDIITVLLSTLV